MAEILPHTAPDYDLENDPPKRGDQGPTVVRIAPDLEGYPDDVVLSQEMAERIIRARLKTTLTDIEE